MFEFRIFFPLPSESVAEELGEDSRLSDYSQALAAIEREFGAVNESDSKDKGASTLMVYVVGGDHWGAKYRGDARKLEVKYRTQVDTLVKEGEGTGTSTSAEDSEERRKKLPILMEAFKKKDYGKGTSIRNKDITNKILEKLLKFCNKEHNTIEHEHRAQIALERETICAMTKWRKHGMGGERGEVCIEYAYIEVDPIVVKPTTTATVTTTAMGMSMDKCMSEEEGDGIWKDSGGTSTPPPPFSSADAAAAPVAAGGATTGSGSGVTKWISISLEGTHDAIQSCVNTSFSSVGHALQVGHATAGIRENILIGGYPTFVGNIYLRYMHTKGATSDGSDGSGSGSGDMYSETELRQLQQNERMDYLLRYLSAIHASNVYAQGPLLSP